MVKDVYPSPVLVYNMCIDVTCHITHIIAAQREARQAYRGGAHLL